MGVGVREAEGGRDLSALEGRSQHPDLRLIDPRGLRSHVGERVILGQIALEIADEIGDLVRVVFDRERARSKRERVRHVLAAAGRAADPEVDPPRVERFEHPEHLGNLERAVVREHHAA